MRAGTGVWQALDRARTLNLKETGEAPPRPGADGISRRRLLAAIGAGAAVATLPGCFRTTARPIVIVGGGLAGLAALDRLRRAGVEAILYEARAAAGGRTRSVRGVFAPDYAFDEGGQLVNSDHADMLALIRSLGLRLVDRKAAPHGELQIGSTGRVSERALAEGLRTIAAQITRDSDRLDGDRVGVGRAIDALSVSQYLDSHGMARGDSRDALEAAIRTEYGAEPGDASALELLFNLPTVDGARLTRLSLSDERYLVEGGAGRVAEGLAARHAAAIRLGKRLTALEFDAHGVQLRFADGEEVKADRAILALPAPLLREVAIGGPLPAPWRALIQEVNLGRNEKVIAGYDRTAWRAAIGTGGAIWSSGGFSEAWDAASVPRADAGPGALTYFLGGDQVAAADRLGAAAAAAGFDGEARRVIPDLPQPNGRLRRTRWCADPLSRGAYISFRPGQLTRFGSLLTVEEQGKARPSVAGPLLFAGEWLSDAWPGYMNGAAQTGRLAADAAIREMARVRS